MAYYLVRARPDWDKLEDLHARLDSGEVGAMRPFGGSLSKGLLGARIESENVAIWEEEDYCTPPLNMERQAVLDDYFEDITVETVGRDEGWERIKDLPSMWRDVPQEAS